ncbi:hypothetical protein XENOCAPTIV_016688 [Xenoophorus captivus]|uniref:Uncharacterized protein n=1 Tax=Xenoophorus captivus TaxID=1517983 RepID=A0ABV0RJ18_9TELE
MRCLTAANSSARSTMINGNNKENFNVEVSGCEEELVQIKSHAELRSHFQQHLSSLASIYNEFLVQGLLVHEHQYSSHAVTDFNLYICKKGNNLLWYLVQNQDAVQAIFGSSY